MRLVSVHIRNYRCLEDVCVQFQDLTSLIGRNGSGKSAVLRAIAAFYGEGDILVPEDWYRGDTDSEVEVALSFTDLTERENESFTHYVSVEGLLKVSRLWRVEEGRVRDSLHGYHLACEEFQPVREAARGVAVLHNNLVDTGRFAGLKKVTRQDDVEAALRDWEAEHPDRCSWMRDGGKFFGWRQVGRAHLEASTTCVYVPAVRDARADAAQGRGSVLTQVVDLVLKAELATNPSFRFLRTQTEKGFADVLDTARPTLKTLATELSDLMQEFAPNSGVVLDWSSDVPTLPDWPPIEARLLDDGVETSVGTKGHGLQRSFIVSLLQRLARARAAATDETSNGSCHTIFLIEEPELYQHPLAARQFAAVLRRLASSSPTTQVAYSTHHPQFIEFDHFDSIRILRKSSGSEDAPPTTSVSTYALQAAASELEELWGLDPDTVTDESTRDRLRTVLTPHVSQGFFAKAVVLVEGVQDEAIIEGYAAATGTDLAAGGIAVIPVGGKANLDRPLIVFAGFGIPCYGIWDADAGQQKERDYNARQNRALCHLVGLPEEDFPDTTVETCAAVFADKLEAELAEATGAEFASLLREAADLVSLSKSRDLLKTRYGCQAFVELLLARGIRVPILQRLIEKILSVPQ